MNKALLLGRFTRDPNVRYGQQSGKAVAAFTLAVDRAGKKQDGEQTADFISCKAFDKRAEFIEKWCSKGTKIWLVGHIATGSYKNKDGNTVYTTDVIVEDCGFAESKSVSAAQPKERADSGEDFMSIPDSLDDVGLPFS